MTQDMRLIALAKVLENPGTPGLSLFHRDMFHGVDKQSRGWSHQPGDIPKEPLGVYKNVYRLARIIQPETNLVISESALAVAPALQGIPRMRVFFHCLFNMTWEVGNFKYQSEIKESDWGNYQDFLRNRQHDPRLQIEPYYELLPPASYEVSTYNMNQDYPGSGRHPDPEQDEVIVEIPNGNNLYKVDCFLPRRTVVEQGLVRIDEIHVFRPDVYEQIAPFINERFFLRSDLIVPVDAPSTPPQRMKVVPQPAPGSVGPKIWRLESLELTTPGDWMEFRMPPGIRVLHPPEPVCGGLQIVNVVRWDRSDKPDREYLMGLVQQSSEMSGRTEVLDQSYEQTGRLQIAGGSIWDAKGNFTRAWWITDQRNIAYLAFIGTNTSPEVLEICEDIIRSISFRCAGPPSSWPLI